MLVRLVHDLQNVDIFRQTPHRSGIWGDIEFTEEDVPECDLLLCLSYPDRGVSVKCSQAWLLSQEPPARIRRWERDSYCYFDKVFSNWRDTQYSSQPCTHWFANLSYDDFVNLKPGAKNRELSWITSNNKDLYGHRLRLQLLNYFKDVALKFDLFGRGFDYLEDKADGLLPYKYSMAIENFSADNYWTEKISDCLLCWTIPLYWGAGNIGKYFPAGSFLLIDPAHPAEVVKTLKRAVADGYYENNINAIAEARDLILNKYQLFPHVCKLIGDNFAISCRREYYIPKNKHPKSDCGIRKLCYKINYNLSKHFNL